ncbi:MAG TPA: SDR family oxidoreductase [Acidimicrobiia bacterium]|nr:SDR family oxidoreductase [Acidimicrobiia bacterium]
MEVRDKVFVVTGGGNGIGRELVLGLVSKGARVSAVDIRQESLDETAALAGAGERVHTSVADVTDREATAALPQKVIAALGAVDGLINNAGIIQPFVKFNDLDFAAIEKVVNVNLYGTVNMCKAFLPYLLERPVAHLANVSSMGGFLPVPGQAVYGATKAAVKLLTEGLYAELLDTGVGVSVIMPGAVGTNITENSGVDIPAGAAQSAEESNIRTTSPAEAARIIIDGIEDDQLHIFVGSDSLMMNVAVRLSPKRSTHLIQKRMKGLLEG